MVVLEKPFWMTAVVLPPKLTRARHLHQFDLGRLGDFDRFAVIIDSLHDDVELPVLNRILQARVLVRDQHDAEGVRIITIASFAMCSCGTSRKPGTEHH